MKFQVLASYSTVINFRILTKKILWSYVQAQQLDKTENVRMEISLLKEISDLKRDLETLKFEKENFSNECTKYETYIGLLESQVICTIERRH